MGKSKARSSIHIRRKYTRFSTPREHRRSSTLSSVLCACLCSLWLSILYAASAQDSTPPPSPPDPRFGTVEAYLAPELADAARVGWERIIFYWSEIERDGPDDWNWFHAPMSRLDPEIASGREIVGLIAHTPAWATDGIEGAGVPNGLYLPLDDPRNYWAQYVRYLVTVYHERVHHWIIWNEPDIPLDAFGAQWQGTLADYYQLVKVAYIVAHQVDPDVRIHLGGLTYWHNPNYLREYLTAASQDPTAAGYGYYFDVVSVHVYFKPETTLDIVGSIQQTLDEFGLGGKPIWLNETNAPPYDDPAQPWQAPVFQVTQEMQADFLLQEFALALSMGVQRIGVYKWVDEPPPPPGFEPYGLIRADGSPRPAYDAYRVITAHYAGTTHTARFERPEMWMILLNRQESEEAGLSTRILWSRVPYTTFVVVPALAPSALRVEPTGAEQTIHPLLGYHFLALEPAPCTPKTDCLMGGSPVALVEEGQADFDHLDAVQPLLVIDLTPRFQAAAGAAALGVAGFAGLIILRRRRRKQWTAGR